MKRKIWVGVGAYVLTNISPAVLAAVHDSGVVESTSSVQQNADELQAQAIILGLGSGVLQLAAAGGEGGEAGEGGEGGEAGAVGGASADEAFVTRMLLMKGHLRVGKELVDQGQWDDAHAHFKHPVEEIYESIEDDLTQRGMTQFEDKLDALAERVQAKAGGEAFEQDYLDVTASIDKAIASIDAGTRTSPDFVLDVALRLLKQAGEEYEAAVADGKIVNVAEYQDSRGFVWVAEDLVRGIADKLQAENAKAYEQLMAQFMELKAAWPSAVPPMRPTASTNEVHGTISRIELAMNDLK